MHRLHCTPLMLALLLHFVVAAEVLLGASLAEVDAEQETDALLTPAEALLNTLPASERGSFLLYQLARAINSRNYAWWEEEHQQEDLYEEEVVVEQHVDASWLAAMANEFQSFPVYESFPLDLEAWLMETYGLYAADVYRGWPSARSTRAEQICNGNGSCFELTRILADCCPF